MFYRLWWLSFCVWDKPILHSNQCHMHILLHHSLVRWKLMLLYPPYECTYGGYYGLVVVTPRPPPRPRPRPQTFHRSHDNLKKSLSDCFHILYVDWYWWGDSWEQDGPGPIIYGPPGAPRIAKNAHFCILWPIYEKLAVMFFPCYTYVCSVMRSYCPEIFVHLGSA